MARRGSGGPPGRLPPPDRARRSRRADHARVALADRRGVRGRGCRHRAGRVARPRTAGPPSCHPGSRTGRGMTAATARRRDGQGRGGETPALASRPTRSLQHERDVVDGPEEQAARETAKLPIHRLPRPEMHGQHPPAAARARQVAQRVQHLAQIHTGRPASPTRRGQQGSDRLPLRLTQYPFEKCPTTQDVGPNGAGRSLHAGPTRRSQTGTQVCRIALPLEDALPRTVFLGPHPAHVGRQTGPTQPDRPFSNGH